MKRRTFFSIFFVFFMIGILLLIGMTCFLFVNHYDKGKVKAYFSTFKFSNDFSEDHMPFSEYNFMNLNSTEKQAYISVLNAIKSHPQYIKIPELTDAEFHNVYFAVKNDNPDILCFSDSCSMITYMSACFLKLNYQYNVDICERMVETLNQKADEIISEISVEDEYSSELQIHDYIVLNCSYDENAANSSNAYGCLVEKKAVCSGYSRAAMILLKKAGIDSMLIGGTGITSEGNSISHMWNLVWINNKPYHLDVTWDDPDSDNDALSHIFFNLTTEEISTDHLDMSANIECVFTDDNYFEKEGLKFTDYTSDTLDKIMKKLKSNIKNGINSIEITFSDTESYNEAVTAIIDNSTPWSDMYKIISYISDEASQTVDVTHINFAKDDTKKYIRMIFDYI